MSKISVIVPVYNTCTELPRCIESICNQTYKDLEIIMIDDGSTDGSEVIVDKYGNLDKRIKVIHQPNSGESNARNRGLSEASGAYITFVDCDDWIDNDMYETMVREAEDNDLDIMAVSWYKDSGAASTPIKNHLNTERGVFDRDKLLHYIYMRDSYRGLAYMWNKLYKRDILELPDGSLKKFDDSLKLGGDVLYVAKAAIDSNRNKYIDKAYYHYNQRAESGVHTLSVLKMKDWIRAYELTIDELLSASVPELTISYVKRFMAYHACEGTQIAIKEHDEKAKMYFQNILKECERDYIRLNSSYPNRIDEYLKIMNL